MDKKSLKILIIEDDEDDAFYIKDILNEGLGKPAPQLDHLSSIESTIKQIDLSAYDLAMFDYRLGEINGIDLIRNFRDKNYNTPIILFTGQGDQEVAVEAMKAGATDYLTKGKLSIESVTHSIRYVLGLHREAQLRILAEKQLKGSHAKLTLAHQELQESIEKLNTAQRQIFRSEKLAGIGRLVAGVCHEILNPLNIISGHTQALLMERESDTTLVPDLNSIMEEIDRITKIINGMLKFSRKGNMKLKESNIVHELESVLTLVEKEIRLKGIQLIQIFKPPAVVVLIDADEIRQVFLNILNNARYAINGKGTLTVSTEICIPNSNWQPISDQNFGRIPDEIIKIKFMDTGTGIKKENLEKIFEPFFTTKPEEKGTGLGLSISYAIIEKHGGNLEVESTVGVGTSVIIDLPIHSPKS